MNQNDLLTLAIAKLRPELPDVLGEQWPGFEATLAQLLPALSQSGRQAEDAHAKILALFSRHGTAYQRLVLAMAEIKIEAMHSSPRFVVAPQSGAKRGPVTRFADIACPRRVWIETPRVAVVVRLKIQPTDFGRMPEAIGFGLGAPVQIHLSAPDFALLSPAVQEVPVLDGRDSPAAVFDLLPRAIGRSGLTVDFYQAGEPAGTATVEVEVTRAEVGEIESPRPTRPLRLGGEPSAPDMVLTIAVQPSPPALEFTLIRDGGAWMRTFAPVAMTGPAQTLAGELYRTIATLVAWSDPTAGAVLNRQLSIPAAEVDRRLKQLGQNLWRSLIPADLKQLYASERGHWKGKTLLILSDEPYLPWELLWPYDATGWEDDAPWSFTLRMTRWLRKDAAGNGNEKPPVKLRLRTWSVLAPRYSLLSKLDGALAERQALLGIAAQHGIVDVSPAEPTWQATIELLERGGYDWLHAAAHGNFYAASPDTDSALWLERDRALAPDVVVGASIESHLRAERPAFFFNACQAGRQGWALTRLGGWANRLIGGGASLLVAPLWEVGDTSAMTFAQVFYTALLDGKTVGEATHAARLAARRPGDPTWLAYSVYAHPNARLVDGQAGF